MTYKNICKCLDGYWEKPWTVLPDVQRQAWREALVINFDEQDAGRRWDGYTTAQRRYVAERYDAQHDPAHEGERHMAWHDVTLNSAMWWKRTSVKPDEAAKLLCRLDPLKGEDPELIFVGGDESSPGRYRVLLRVFNDVAETVPKARTLLDWLCVAQREGLRYHSWIDEYALAMPVVTQEGEDGGAAKKRGGRKPGKQRERLGQILDALEVWAAKHKETFDRHAMPGQVGTGGEDEGGFHWFCVNLGAKFKTDFHKSARTFEDYRAGLCTFPPYAKRSDFYSRALPDIAQSLQPIVKTSTLSKVSRKAA